MNWSCNTPCSSTITQAWLNRPHWHSWQEMRYWSWLIGEFWTMAPLATNLLSYRCLTPVILSYVLKHMLPGFFWSAIATAIDILIHSALYDIISNMPATNCTTNQLDVSIHSTLSLGLVADRCVSHACKACAVRSCRPLMVVWPLQYCTDGQYK
jgi:hypothetical protein